MRGVIQASPEEQTQQNACGLMGPIIRRDFQLEPARGLHHVLVPPARGRLPAGVACSQRRLGKLFPQPEILRFAWAHGSSSELFCIQ